MALLFPQQTNNVIDAVNGKESLAEHFDGGIFDDADEVSNLFGIGKTKRKARKAKKRFEKSAAKKYKLETERIRALQGQPKENIVKDIANGLTSVAGSIFGGASAAQPEQTFTEQIPAQAYQKPQPQKNNTVLYIVLAAVAVGAIFILKK